ncbi:hypothetical protein HDR59_03905 [bacterium]|nr:hypothetical protein [bacterium]
MNNITKDEIRDIIREETARVIDLKKQEKFLKQWVKIKEKDYDFYVYTKTVIADDVYEEEIPAPADMLSKKKFLKKECKKEGISYEAVKNYLISKKQKKAMLKSQLKQR